MKKLLLGLPVGLAFSLAAACGGSDSNGESSGGTGGGDFSTDLPGDKPLGDLTPGEAMQLCDDLATYYSSGSVAADLQEFSCRFGAIFSAAFAQPMTDAEAQAACQMGYDSCMEDPGQGMDQCSEPTGECTATVAELEACMNDSKAYFAMLKDTFPACSEVTLADLEGGGEPSNAPMSPASCTTLEMKCPGGPLPPSAGM